jgi:hypothetical protein
MREMSDAASGVRAMISRRLDGHDVSMEGLVTLDAEMLTLATTRGRVAVPITALSGAREENGVLLVYRRRGDVVRVGPAAELRGLALELERRVHTLPELTRSLRALGSHRAAAIAEHDRFFAPFLSARRTAEAGGSTPVILDAFSAPVLRAALLDTLATFAAERYPDEPPERRALHAELVDDVAPLLARLDALGAARTSLEQSADAVRYDAWRAWTAALQRVFDCADECWEQVRAVLDPERRGRVSAWRRLVRRTGSRRGRKR